MKLLLFSFTWLPFTLSFNTRSASPKCRCRPHEPCWPSPEQWQALNQSVDGTLHAVKPVALNCHDPTYDAAVCNATTELSGQSTWRTSQPGAVQWTNWEAWPERNESCYFDTDRSIPCGQGRISLYSVMAEKPEHIQAAVKFVSKYNVRLAIKNTGHCFLGRSTAPESLQIATTKLRDITFTDDFRLSGHSGPSQGPAVTIGAGVQLAELYVAAAKHNKTVIVGLSHTVGAAGGYIQGGGHSPFGPWKGMGSDNALEFNVVTADGKHLTANARQNRDLFWALRGGGGGTFGVVTSVTIRTFPDVPGQFVQMTIASPKSKMTQYWSLLAKFHQMLPAFSDAGLSGYYTMAPGTDVNGTTMSVLDLTLFFVNVTDMTTGTKLLDELKHEAAKVQSDAKYDLSPVPFIAQAIAVALQAPPTYDSLGGIVITGSRLISRDLLSKPDGPTELINALRDIYNMGTEVGYTGHIVAGGAVATNKVDSAINPAWRKALTHIVFGQDWPSNATLAEQQAVQHELTNVLVERIRELEPDMGAYLNEADAHEKDFQQSFWGDNYKRLYKIKQHVDPKNIFIARRGVGSENWDDNGLCRI